MNKTNELPINTLSKILAQKEVMVNNSHTFSLHDIPPNMTLDEFIIKVWNENISHQTVDIENALL